MKRLIICPSCLKEGKRQILGELDKNGNFVVQRRRSHDGRGDTTIISSQFIVQCGQCKEIVFVRKKV